MYFSVHMIYFKKTFEEKMQPGLGIAFIAITDTWKQLTLGFIRQKNNRKAWASDSDV